MTKENYQELLFQLGDHIRRHENLQLGPCCWPGKPEGSSVVTMFPNLVAEIACADTWIWNIEEAANLSKEMVAAVIEDGEELTLGELRGIAQRINFATDSPFLVSIDYLICPTLSMFDTSSRKGRYRLHLLETWLERIDESDALNQLFYIPRARRVIEKMRAGRIVPYAEFRTAAAPVFRSVNAPVREQERARRKRTKRLPPKKSALIGGAER